MATKMGVSRSEWQAAQEESQVQSTALNSGGIVISGTVQIVAPFAPPEGSGRQNTEGMVMVERVAICKNGDRLRIKAWEDPNADAIDKKNCVELPEHYKPPISVVMKRMGRSVGHKDAAHVHDNDIATISGPDNFGDKRPSPVSASDSSKGAVNEFDADSSDSGSDCSTLQELLSVIHTFNGAHESVDDHIDRDEVLSKMYFTKKKKRDDRGGGQKQSRSQGSGDVHRGKNKKDKT